MKPRPKVGRNSRGWYVHMVHGIGIGATFTFRQFRTHAAALAYANEIAGLRATQPAWHRGEKEQP